MVGISSYVLGLATRVGLLIMGLLLLSLLISAQSAGNTVSAFTTTSFQITDVWVMDVSRLVSVHLQVTGPRNDIPVWSTQERRLIYFPRTP